MSLILQFGVNVLGAAASLAVSREAAAPESAETWRVELDIEAVTPAALEPAIAAIRALQGTQAGLQLLYGGAPVRTLAVAGCRLGPVLHGLREHDLVPDDAHNLRRLTLEFRATLQTASAVQSHDFVVSAIMAAGAPARLLIRGRAVLHAGEDPATHEAMLLPAIPAGYRRARLATTRDALGPTLEYEAQDEQVFTALPGGVDDGHYVISEHVTADGRALRTLAGFFVGVGARSRALELRPPDERIAASRVSENPFTRRVDFEFTELGASDGTLALTESLTFTTTRRVIDHPLLDTALPAYRQQVGSPQTEVVQEGSAIGSGRHATPPAPRFAADLIERRVHYSLPHPGLAAERRWVTTWRYVSRGRGEVFARVEA
jgi:hypothetical protein